MQGSVAAEEPAKRLKLDEGTKDIDMTPVAAAKVDEPVAETKPPVEAPQVQVPDSNKEMAAADEAVALPAMRLQVEMQPRVLPSVVVRA